jgi:DNA repair exonuclease SbcCD nuclease subunit
MKAWYDQEFFPTLKKNNVKEVIHGGDFFDSRNAIGLQDIDFVVNWFAKRLIADNIHITVVLGNHDVAFKNTNKIHSLSILKAAAPNNVTVIEDALLKEIDGQEYALVPWINSSNYNDTVQFLNNIKNKQDVIVVGHFEFAGFKHYKNSPLAEHGMDSLILKDFKAVWSGHFHHPSSNRNVQYLGSPFYLNWQDVGDDRGFWLFDGKLHYQKNEYCLFVKIAYDAKVLKAMTDDEYKDAFKDRFVMLVVDEEYKKSELLDIVSRINKATPHDLQVINNVDLKASTESTEQEAQDKTGKSTLEYIESYIKDSEVQDKSVIVTMLTDAYTRAQDAMAVGE